MLTWNNRDFFKKHPWENKSPELEKSLQHDSQGFVLLRVIKELLKIPWEFKNGPGMLQFLAG